MCVKSLFKSSHFIGSALSLTLVVGCGSSHDSKNPETAATKSIEYNGAYSECAQLLEHGIFENFDYSKAGSYLNEIAGKFCTYSAYTAEQKYRNMVSSLKDKRANGNFEGDLDVIGIFTVGIGAGGGTSKAENFSSDEFKSAFASWKQQSCGQYSNYTDSEFVYNTTSKIVNNSGIEAWRQCVTKKQAGIFCHVKENQNTLSVMVEYEKPYFEAPNKLNLEWSTVYNLTTLSSNLPSYVGPSVGGTGVRASFKVSNTTQEAIVDINARSDALTLSCGVSIPVKRPDFQIPRYDNKDQKCERARLVAYKNGIVSENYYKELKVKNWGPIYKEDHRPQSGIMAWAYCDQDLSDAL